jgi:sporulation protein YqfC
MSEQLLRGYLSRVSARLELPSDLIAGLPKLELTGYGELLLEHHDGVAHYSPEEIAVHVSLGTIRIQGDGLRIRLMNSKRIAILGDIHSITLEGATP